MGNLKIIEHISLDGVIQGPGGKYEDTSNGFSRGGWIADYADDILGAYIKEIMGSDFNLLLGRHTYDAWAAYWPLHDDIWPKANSATKYVASNTLLAGDWKNTVVLSGNVTDQIKKIKNESGKEIHVWGSGTLVQLLLKNAVADTLSLMIYPVVLGGGKRLFQDSSLQGAYTVVNSFCTPKGVIVAEYELA